MDLLPVLLSIFNQPGGGLGGINTEKVNCVLGEVPEGLENGQTDMAIIKQFTDGF
jgi:hypothetical protein